MVLSSFFTSRNLLLLIFLFSIQFHSSLSAQTFLNGSFELNDVDDCAGNLVNSLFTSLISNTVAFGEKNEVDILSEACGYGSATDGNYFLGLNHDSTSDAISIELAEELIAGRRYAFSFDVQSSPINLGISRMRIGVSNQAEEFGQEIYETDDLSTVWREEIVIFTAPSNARYITAMPKVGVSNWMFIDNFRKYCPENISLGNDTTLCELNDLRLGVEGTYDSYRWQDNSTAPTYQVQAPGTFWLEVMLNDCLLSDTIQIEEAPFICNCQVYVPTAFSPNADGINDRFSAYSACSFIFFELMVFDRWGNNVFLSINPDDSWNGNYKNKALNPGQYIYSIRYQFENESIIQHKSGGVILIR